MCKLGNNKEKYATRPKKKKCYKRKLPDKFDQSYVCVTKEKKNPDVHVIYSCVYKKSDRCGQKDIFSQNY